MVDAPAHAPSERKACRQSRRPDPAPTLATAPEGLSPRRVERWLDLPPGAWQRRRLYALRVKGTAFEGLGFRRGDFVIVEPGARQQPGTIVVTRSQLGVSLKRVASHSTRPSAGDRRMPTVLELPLRDRSAEISEHIVGSVIGRLRATGTGALRPVALYSARPKKRGEPRDATPDRSAAPTNADLSPDTLGRLHDQWQKWLRTRRESGESMAEELERWDRLDGSLAALCECLARTHNTELRAALLDEAATLTATAVGEMRRYSNYPFLQ
ncbi:MAG TPA: S24 family peptidase [Candidatus Limnocylindrales bacterium]|nr:S24 family peptidase [Candidatus Limnocylindrales bacterium]